MQNTYKIATSSTLFNAGAEWTVTIDDEQHMLKYQVYANTLVAAVVAKLGEYAIELSSNPDALKDGTQKLVEKIAEA